MRAGYRRTRPPSASSTTSSATIWREISERRARNMKLFAAELIATGDVRRGLDVDRVADILWATNGPELYTLLADERGWPAEELERWLPTRGRGYSAEALDGRASVPEARSWRRGHR